MQANKQIITYKQIYPITPNEDKPNSHLVDCLDIKDAKPFIKWVGGKTKLLPEINANMPDDIHETDTYVEPFIGAGSVFLNMMKLYNFNHVIINDINPALIAIYKNIKDHPDHLMIEIDNLSNEFMKLPHVDVSKDKSDFYYAVRHKFNTESRTSVVGSARFIFLNKYCYNGLYRENKKGEFNSSFNGDNYNKLYDPLNIKKISQILNSKNKNGEYKVTILSGDYKQTLDYVKTTNVFVYMDPPYRPVTPGGFRDYHKVKFNDDSQRELKDFCLRIHQGGAKFMLSNSDPKNQKDAATPEFFDELYDGCNIKRVSMTRSVNSKGNGRGPVTELLITNYNNEENNERD